MNALPVAPAAPAPVTTPRITASRPDGKTVDLSNQTTISPDGTTAPLNTDTAPPPSTTPSPGMTSHVEVMAAYPFNDTSGGHPYADAYYFNGPENAVTRDAAGNITAVTDTGSGGHNDSYRASLSQSGSTLTDSGKDTATGLSWGRWQGGTVTRSSQYWGTDAGGNSGLGAYNSSGTFVIGGVDTMSSVLGTGSLHWIAGSGAAPDYLPQVLTGTANYTLIGGTRPTDLLGRTGTLNSASLGVNFSSQLANANVNFTIGSDTWNMRSTDMQLYGPSFSSTMSCTETSCASSVVLTKNGAATSTTGTATTGFAMGSMNGALTGLGLNGAGLQYSVTEAVPGSVDPVTGYTTFTDNVIQGVAALSGPVQDTQTPFRAVGISDGWGNGEEWYYKSSSLATSTLYRGSIDSGEAPAARVVTDASGALSEFIGRAYDYTPQGAPGPTAATSYEGTPATIKIGSAVNQDVGSLTINGTTVSWGRWEGGAIDIYSRDGSAKLGTIDNTGRSLHWIASPVMTSDSTFTSLPLTGTATYTYAGGTRPTDMLGNVGTLNSATLSADFSNARVNAGVNVSFNTATNNATWNMTANNIPLRGRDGFQSSTMLNGMNGITHTASCSGGTCGAQTVGGINGVFIGSGQGAVVMYNMATGSSTTATSTTPGTFNPANAVSGVAIMKR